MKTWEQKKKKKNKEGRKEKTKLFKFYEMGHIQELQEIIPRPLIFSLYHCTKKKKYSRLPLKRMICSHLLQHLHIDYKVRPNKSHNVRKEFNLHCYGGPAELEIAKVPLYCFKHVYKKYNIFKTLQYTII